MGLCRSFPFAWRVECGFSDRRSFESSLILVGVWCWRPMIRFHWQVAGPGRAVFGTDNPWTEKENEISRNGRQPSLPVALLGVSCLLLRVFRVCTWHVRHTSTGSLHAACILSTSRTSDHAAFSQDQVCSVVLDLAITVRFW